MHLWGGALGSEPDWGSVDSPAAAIAAVRQKGGNGTQ